MNTRKKGKTSGDAAHAAHVQEPAVEAAMSRDIINVPDNVFLQVTTEYDPRDREALEWMLGYARTHLDGSRGRLCRAMQMDWKDIFAALSGDVRDSFRKVIDRAMAIRTHVFASHNPDFIDTVVTRRIFELLDYALAGDEESGKMVMIVGPTGRSKTHAAKEWARLNNHGRSVYLDCPVERGLRGIARALAGMVGVGDGRKTTELVPRVLDSFHRKRIILLDETARVVPTSWASRPAETELIRKIHDNKKTAVAWIVTEHTRRELESGQMKHYFEQLIGRISDTLYIPRDTRVDEARAIANHFCARVAVKIGERGTPKATPQLIELCHAIAQQPGRLRILFEHLRKAAIFAEHKKALLTADHLQLVAKRSADRNVWPEDES